MFLAFRGAGLSVLSSRAGVRAVSGALAVLGVALADAPWADQVKDLPGAYNAPPGQMAPFFGSGANSLPSLKPGSASADDGYKTENFFGCTNANGSDDVKFSLAIRVLQHPNDPTKLLILQKNGEAYWMPNSPTACEGDKELFLDISAVMQGIDKGGEGGVGGVALHPNFGLPNTDHNDEVFVWYRWAPDEADQPSGDFYGDGEGDGGTQAGQNVIGYNRLSRFTLPNETNNVITKANAGGFEEVMLQQLDVQQWHIGGAMAFDDQNFLYIALGDQGNVQEKFTQQVDSLFFSGVLRIDPDKQGGNISHPIRRQPENNVHTKNGANQNITLASWMTDSFSNTDAYYIPKSNPFVAETSIDAACSGFEGSGEAKCLEEYYALGMRHPWTMERDATGALYIGDVGAQSREEVSVVTDAGTNLQWNVCEGTDCSAGYTNQPGGAARWTDPLIDYDHDGDPVLTDVDGAVIQGQSVIVGGIYRGTALPDLTNNLIFADYTTQGGKVWMRESNGDVTELATAKNAVEFLFDTNGRILMASYVGNDVDGSNPQSEILELVPNGQTSEEPPAKLSDTGLFDDTATLNFNDACLPYEQNEQFWSDGAEKYRWLCVPNNGAHNTSAEQIIFSETDFWQWPVGSVLVKHFEMPEMNPSLGYGVGLSGQQNTKRMETRIIVHGEDGWYAIDYIWDDNQQDATLNEVVRAQKIAANEDVPAQGVSEFFDREFSDPNDPRTEDFTWFYPGRAQCLECHATFNGFTLGASARQLNREITFPNGQTANQLATYEELNYFTSSIGDLDLDTLITIATAEDTTKSLELRARSYIDANCGYCHRPDSGIRANYDGRLVTALADTNMIYGIQNETLGIPGEAYIVPGDLVKSSMYHRTEVLGGGAMPPLGKGLLDLTGLELFSDWVERFGYVGNVEDAEADGQFADSHNPSVIVNESDQYVNDTGAPMDLFLGDWTFYARAQGRQNTVTPFVGLLNGNDDVTVLKIGTPRTSNDYSAGQQNTFRFLEGEFPEITLPAGAALVTGFTDQDPSDNTGWGQGGNPIPAGANGGAGQDEAFGLLGQSTEFGSGGNSLILNNVGFQASLVGGEDIPTVVEGEALDQSNDINPNIPSGETSNVKLFNYARSYHFAVQVLDATFREGALATQNIDDPGNQTPIVSNPGAQTTEVGAAVSLAIQASDPDAGQGDTLTYGASGLPAGLTINTSTGVITGTPTTAGQSSVTVTASDGNSAGQVAFTWTVSLDGGALGPNLLINPELDALDGGGQPLTCPNPASNPGVWGLFAEMLGWSADGAAPFEVQSCASDPFVELNGSAPSQIVQTVTVTPGDYTVSFLYRERPDRIEGLDDGSNMQVLALLGDDEQVVLDSGVFNDGVDGVANGWGPKTFTFTTGGGDLKLVLRSAVLDGNVGGHVDSVSLRKFTSGSGNNAPVLTTTPSNRIDTLGDTVNIPIAASDADSDPLTLNAAPLPAGVSFTQLTDTTAELTGTLTTLAEGLLVTVSASDGEAQTTSDFVWTIEPESSDGSGRIGAGLNLPSAWSEGQNDFWVDYVVVSLDPSIGFTNDTGQDETLTLTDWTFNIRSAAGENGAQVRPFVMLLDNGGLGDVIAIGDKVTKAVYTPGVNTRPFSATPTEIVVQPGETIVPGFITSYTAQATEGQSVITHTRTGGPVWQSGGKAVGDAGSIALGAPPTPGTSVAGAPNSARTYHFNIAYAAGSLDPGTPGDDVIIGGAGPQNFRGKKGDDVLSGKSGPDTLNGGPGNDLVRGGSGIDKLYGGAGDDDLRGGPGADFLSGGPGRDNLQGGPDADVFLLDQTDVRDVIGDFNPAQDIIRIDTSATGADSFDDLRIVRIDGGTAARIWVEIEGVDVELARLNNLDPNYTFAANVFDYRP